MIGTKVGLKAMVEDTKASHAAEIFLLFVVGIVAAFGFDVLGLQSENAFMIFILGIVIAVIETNSAVWGVVLGIAYPLTFDLLFVEPRLQLHSHDAGFFISCGVFVVVALMVSSLTGRLKRQLEIAKRDEEALEILNKISTGLMNSSSAEDACARSSRALTSALERNTELRLGAPDRENRAASLCFDAGCPTGAGEADWSTESRKYLPLRTKAHTYGVASVDCSEGDLDDIERSLLDSVIAQTVIAVERNEFDLAARDSKISNDYDRLKTNLLRTVSQNMREPLLDISNAVRSIVEDEANPLGKQAADSLIAIDDDARMLLKTFEGMVNIVRVQDAGSQLKKEPARIGEVMNEAAGMFAGKLGKHDLRIFLPDGDIIASMHRPMIVQVLFQLIDNVLTHTYPDSRINVTAVSKLGMLSVSVADNGGGIDPDQIALVFNRFYVGDSPVYQRSKGMGIGLSVCQSIIEAHDGFIVAENNRDGGATITFSIPLDDHDGSVRARG